MNRLQLGERGPKKTKKLQPKSTARKTLIQLERIFKTDSRIHGAVWRCGSFFFFFNPKIIFSYRYIIARALRLRVHTPITVQKYRTPQEHSGWLVLSSSAVWWGGKGLFCSKSRPPTPTHCSPSPTHPFHYPTPPFGGLLLYVAILSKVKRSDLLLHFSTLTLPINPTGVWAEMIEAAYPPTPPHPDWRPPPPLFPSLLSSLPTSFTYYLLCRSITCKSMQKMHIIYLFFLFVCLEFYHLEAIGVAGARGTVSWSLLRLSRYRSQSWPCSCMLYASA